MNVFFVFYFMVFFSALLLCPLVASSIVSFYIGGAEKSIHSSGISARRNMSNLAVKKCVVKLKAKKDERKKIRANE